ncbi:MAG: cell division ATP-binding protein FtsE, partial [Patescibacteria group bacterium]
KKYHPDVQALKGVNLNIKPGEFVSLVGQSGTGKTTLVKLLIADERPDNGKVIVGGWDITNIKNRHVPVLRRQIGVVFQDYKLLPRKTVAENIAFALQVAGKKGKEIEKIMQQVLKIVGLEDKYKRFPLQLSGGEQQRVSIARALVHRPKILVADEPTGNLDSINTRDVMDLLQKINEFGTTILLVTHNREVVNALRRRVVTIDDGEIIGDHQQGKYIL